MKTKSAINSTYNSTLANQPLFKTSSISARKINRILNQKLDKTYQSKSNLSIITNLSK